MVCIFDNASARFLKVNSVFSQVLGYSKADLLNNPIYTFIHPDDIDATRKIVQEKIGQGCSVFSFVNRIADRTAVTAGWNGMRDPSPIAG